MANTQGQLTHIDDDRDTYPSFMLCGRPSSSIIPPEESANSFFLYQEDVERGTLGLVNYCKGCLAEAKGLR